MTRNEQLQSEIDALKADSMIATDEGTHGHADCVRCYEKLDGTVYYVRVVNGQILHTLPNCPPSHGTIRKLRTIGHKKRQEMIRKKRELIFVNRGQDMHHEKRREELRNGWDGFRFVGVEQGQKLAEQL